MTYTPKNDCCLEKYPGITNSHLFVSTNQAQSHSYLFKLRHKMSPEKNMRKCDNAKRIGVGEK